MGGLNTYIAEPKEQLSGKKIILFLSDVYGPLFINNQLLEDFYASCGFIVLGPDYLFGDAVPDQPAGFDLHVWALKKWKVARDAFPKWLEAVEQTYGTKDVKYFALGYCFGGPFVMDLAAGDFIEAGAIAHPGHVDENHFENLKKPLLLSCPEDDFTFPTEARRRAEDIMVKNKASYYFQIFSGVKHGYAVRGNPEAEHERWAKEETVRGVKEWFARFS